MIDFQEFKLDNGLHVIFHQDKTTPIAAVNLLYNVGSRNENEAQTGFAHLFEHLMFGGSINIPNYDSPLQEVGGENNAFTSNDITNYYITLPKENIETALWLESDRMLNLAFTDKSLEVQRQVVIEEFKQRYLNQPYGDVYLLLRPLAYKKHPYKWATIGKEISHIEDAKMEDVKAFFQKFYRPNNAILSIGGDFELKEIKQLTNKWFGEIISKPTLEDLIEAEPVQIKQRTLTVHRDVPVDAIYMAYHMSGKNDPEYYATDLLSDILSNGDSSRFHENLLKNTNYFTEINAYVSGDVDPGLFIISAKLNPGVKIQDAENAIDNELDQIKNNAIPDLELEKVKKKAEAVFEFGKTSILNKTMGLAIAANTGDANLVNTEFDLYKAVTTEAIQKVASAIFVKQNQSILYYLTNKK